MINFSSLDANQMEVNSAPSNPKEVVGLYQLEFRDKKDFKMVIKNKLENQNAKMGDATARAQFTNLTN